MKKTAISVKRKKDSTKRSETKLDASARRQKLERELVKKYKGKLSNAVVNIAALSNNCIINLCKLNGESIFQSSAGKVGMSGSSSTSPYTAERTASEVADVITLLGILSVEVRIRGIGRNRDLPIKVIAGRNIKITSIRDITTWAFGGTDPANIRHT